MRQVVIAGHGSFSEGIYSSVKIILGEKDFVHTLNCYLDPKQDVAGDIEKLLDSFDPEDEIICFTDVFGGSVNNEFMKHLTRPNLHLITGTNLGLLINSLLNIDQDLDLLLGEGLKEAQNGLIYCNDLLDDMEDESF